MTSKPFCIVLAFCTLLFSCDSTDSSDDTGMPSGIALNTTVYPSQPMQVLPPANLQLSFTGRTVTDSSVFYQVIAGYKGKEVGFNLSIPKKEFGTGYLFSRGKISDDFLRSLQEIYGQPVDTEARFQDAVPAEFSALGALVVNGQDLGTMGKLVFKGKTGTDSTSLFLDINEKDHWVQLSEKDSTYRKNVIDDLIKK